MTWMTEKHYFSSLLRNQLQVENRDCVYTRTQRMPATISVVKKQNDGDR